MEVLLHKSTPITVNIDPLIENMESYIVPNIHKPLLALRRIQPTQTPNWPCLHADEMWGA